MTIAGGVLYLYETTNHCNNKKSKDRNSAMLGLPKSKKPKTKPQQGRQRQQRKEKRPNSKENESTSRTSSKGRDRRLKASANNKTLKRDGKNKATTVEGREDAAVTKRGGDLQERNSANSSRISWGPNTSCDGDNSPKGSTPVNTSVVPAIKILRKTNNDEIPKSGTKKSYDCFGFVPKPDGDRQIIIHKDQRVPSKGSYQMINANDMRQIEGEQDFARLVKQSAATIVAELNRSYSKSCSKLDKNSTMNRERNCQRGNYATNNSDVRLNQRSFPTRNNRRRCPSLSAQQEDDSTIENQCVELIALKTRDGRNAAGVVKQHTVNYQNCSKIAKKRELHKHESGLKEDTTGRAQKAQVTKKEPALKQDSRSDPIVMRNNPRQEINRGKPIAKHDNRNDSNGIQNMTKQEMAKEEPKVNQDFRTNQNKTEIAVNKEEVVNKETVIIQAIRYDESSEETTESNSVRQDWESISTCSTNSSYSEAVDPPGDVLLPPCRLGRSNSCADLEPEGQVLLPPSGVSTTHVNADSDDESLNDEDFIDNIEQQIENRLDEILTTLVS